NMRKTAEDAAAIRRTAHHPEDTYGTVISFDDRAALVLANFAAGYIDYRRIFTEINERVIAPFEKGWIGALIKGRDALKGEQTAPARVEVVYRDTAAAKAGLKIDD